MWKILRSFLIFIAALATFILVVLEILKNHVGIDTHAMLMQMGSDLGSAVVWAQAGFAAIVESVASLVAGLSGASGSVGTIETLTNVLALIASIIAILNYFVQSRRGE